MFNDSSATVSVSTCYAVCGSREISNIGLIILSLRMMILERNMIRSLEEAHHDPRQESILIMTANNSDTNKVSFAALDIE